MYEVKRDFCGYGAHPPDPKWPGGARLALNLAMNYEEGSEPSMQDGEGFAETGLTEGWGRTQDVRGRDLVGEGMLDYGSRVGFRRLMRLFQERNLPTTVFGCALAIERNPRAAGLERLLDHVARHSGVWITPRVDIARHSIATHPYPGRRLNE